MFPLLHQWSNRSLTLAQLKLVGTDPPPRKAALADHYVATGNI